MPTLLQLLPDLHIQGILEVHILWQLHMDHLIILRLLQICIDLNIEMELNYLIVLYLNFVLPLQYYEVDSFVIFLKLEVFQ